MEEEAVQTLKATLVDLTKWVERNLTWSSKPYTFDIIVRFLADNFANLSSPYETCHTSIYSIG